MVEMAGNGFEVNLEEQSGRFRRDKSRSISGTVSAESDGIRTRIRLDAVNLRREDGRKYRYYLMLLGLDHGKSLHKVLGDILSDEKGDVTSWFEVDNNNADGKGNSLEKFSIYMVVAASVMNRMEPYHPVLKGDFYNRCTKPAAERTDMAAEQTEKSVHRTDTAPEQTDLSVCGDRYGGFYYEYVRMVGRRLISGKDRYARIVPFDDGWLSDRWYRVDGMDGFMDFPVASVSAGGQIREYGHYIFAFNDEYLLLGVPGKNDPDDQPDGGASGFALWHVIKGSATYGYWLAVIHRETGKITDFQGQRAFGR